MNNIKLIKGLFIITSLSFAVGCTNLDEVVLDGTSKQASVNATSFLVTAYRNLRGFQAQGQMFALAEMSSDALVGPTRGGDWDDNGVWRKIHLHQWGPEHGEVRNAYSALLSAVNNCNIVIENGSAAEVAEARFLKSFFYYHAIDLFGKVPYRTIGEPSSETPKVYTRAEATNFVIGELEAILNELPNRVVGSPEKANKDAARFLLAKLYLNKAVFTAPEGSTTFTHSSTDMTKVVEYVDAINSSSLAANYWDNFSPTNHTSNELLFVSKNELGDGGDIRSRWHMGAHYNQTPSGWNGFTTLGEYYDRFDPNDKRINYEKPNVTATNGYKLGFQIGQQFGPGGAPLNDRNGNPLIFTKEITIVTGGNTLETAGIRGMKYEPSPIVGDVAANDYVLMRYSDALLMKAEAILRAGTGTLPDMTAYNARTGVVADISTLDKVYAERGRELWWEGWRRNDMIRFGKFLEARELKPTVSDAKYLLYPIPTAALYNPNMTQNPGY
jgi:starch-binding outer membrane protein, SusD/RagB family